MPRAASRAKEEQPAASRTQIHQQIDDVLQHLVAGVREGRADAVLAASIFHFGEYTVAEAKQAMAAPALWVSRTWAII